VEILRKLDPAGAAAGELGQSHGLPVDQGGLETHQQLGAFFKDGQIGGEVGVEHAGEAQPAQRGHHPAGDQRARPAGRKHSPSPARIAGAVCTMTCLEGSLRAAQTRSMWSFSVMAAVGQTAAHWPHCTQATLASS